MRTVAAAIAAGLLLSACGGGQTGTTEAEEALNNEYQPAAPSPGGEADAANGIGAMRDGEAGGGNMNNGAAPSAAGNSL